MSSVFLEDISSKKGLAQVMVFAWEFKDETCDFKKKKTNNIMAFQGENWNPISSPQIIRSIDSFPVGGTASNWLKQQSPQFALWGHPTV